VHAKAKKAETCFFFFFFVFFATVLRHLIISLIFANRTDSFLGALLLTSFLVWSPLLRQLHLRTPSLITPPPSFAS
jgi:hypothetical protein